MMMVRRFLAVFACSLLLISSSSFAAEKSPQATAEPDGSAPTKQPASPPRKSFPFSDIFSTNSQAKVEAQADSLEYTKDSKLLIGKGNVTLTYQKTVLTADYAEIETSTKKAYARGHVVIFNNGKATAQGDEIHYDFETKAGSFPDGRSVSPPWFSKGEDIQQIKEGVKIIKLGGVTTCDLREPHYQIRAKKVTIYDGDKMIAQNVTIHILGKPVFWLPYMIIPLQQNNMPFALLAGYNSRDGAYIGVLKGISLTKNIYGKFRVDWRSERGVGGGGDISYNFMNLGYGLVNLYITQDSKAPTPEAANPFDAEQDKTRSRITWRHRKDFNPETFMLLRYNKLTDEYVLQDFFENEYRSEIEPNSFVSLTHNSRQVAALLHTEVRVNDFERTVEHLPKLQLDWKTQPLLQPWLFYQSEISFDNMTKRYGRSMKNNDVIRTDQFNEWSAPVQWKNIKFTPYGKLRETLYSRDLETSSSRFRLYGELGADLRTHFYRTFQVHFEKLGMEVNQLRHVVEPYTKYRVGTSTVSDEKLAVFDTVDRLDDAQVVTFGVENRIQTKREVNGKMQRVDLVSLNTFMSYELYPDGYAVENLYGPYTTGFTDSNFGMLGQELVLRPYEWLQYQLSYDFDTRSSQFKMFNQDIVLRPGKFRMTFGHRLINDVPNFEESNQFVFDGLYTLNDRWALNGFVLWDPKGDNLQEWQVGAQRDLHDFILNFGYNVRNSDIDSNNQTLYFELYMKEFPTLGINAGGGKASFAPPRIGDTVSGSNQLDYSTASSRR